MTVWLKPGVYVQRIDFEIEPMPLTFTLDYRPDKKYPYLWTAQRKANHARKIKGKIRKHMPDSLVTIENNMLRNPRENWSTIINNTDIFVSLITEAENVEFIFLTSCGVFDP